ncbi:uncharacterized protein ZBAI_07033 [Zygosaccharomyces bailii ISA1307]|uniref:ZYBA0S05-08196g1_1 n=1 Tax=Zygosaccharomyces bailii (strain CLIB 213 / ATCC 58445 / CBS 680 / BCRC 21525 / NBRC 1098 / NCYC 1416 / NRRL Y-2227) TaxID=1333698 RepID=A0A8J2XBB4_ZYGB2|nr:ZYBA0S05-08196g1_1 [Zygosaccharomyces bailii CLIB 213]CDH15246.1 uncharacterized protein ZBAI_07033 [Zygosaccharomyces bailii ISA1307]
MEFFYDEQALASEQPSTAKHDEKTEEAFNKLEDEVSKQYDKTAQALKKFVAESEDGVKLNLPLDPETSLKAQRYLGQLDSNLQNVEKVAQGYWTKVSNPGFWSSMTNSLSSKLEQVVRVNDEELNQNASKAVVGGNRTESELRALSTDKSIYLDNKSAAPASFDVDDKTEEISKILEKDKDLANLMNEIVPQSIPYKDFWNTYFTLRQKIFEMENNRRKILEGKQDSKDEEIAWDEEEDETEGNEEEGNDKNREEPVIIKKEDTEQQEKKGDNGQEVAEQITRENDEDEDDDDWE